MWRLLLFLGFMALGTALVYSVVVRSPQAPHAETARLPFHVLSLETVHLTFSDESAQHVEIWSTQAVYDEKRQLVDMDQVRFEITEAPGGNADGSVLRGTARRAVLDNRGSRVVLTGKVRLVRDEDLEIKGERVVYEHGPGRVLVPEEVWIRSGTSVHEGRGMEYSLAERAMTLGAPRLTQ